MSKHRRARVVGLILLAVSTAAVGLSVGFMAERIAEHNRRTEPEPVAMQPVEQDAFEWRGVEFEARTVGTHPPSVVVEWGGESVTLPVFGKDVEPLPGILRHRDWLKILFLAEGQHDLDTLNRDVLEGRVDARLVVVARGPAPGFDPESWGAAKYKDWVYTFLTLQPDGTIARDEATYREVFDEPYSWRHAAAMEVTPGLNTPSARSTSPISYPNYRGVRDVIDAMGWTWPVFGVGAIGFLVGLLLFLSSFVRRQKQWG